MNQIRLAKPWSGPTLTDVPYFMVRWTKHTDPKVYALRLSDYLTRLKAIPENIEEIGGQVAADAAAVASALTTITQAASDVDANRQAVDVAAAAIDAAQVTTLEARDEAVAARDVAVSAAGSTQSLWDSRAAAQAADIPAPVQYLRTAGYAAVGDGGGALYKRLGAAPSSPTARHFQSADGAWWDLAEVQVNPRMLGAKGDNATNDTAAFNALPSGNVLISPGTYRLRGFVPKSGTTYQAPRGNVTLVQDADASPIVSLAAGTQNITFDGIDFIGRPTSSSGACVILDNNAATYRNKIVWRNCSFDNFGGMALVLGGLKGGEILACRFTRTAQLNTPSGATSYPAIWISDASAGNYTATSDLLIQGCSFEDMYWSGIYACGIRIRIVDNSFRATRESTIFINPNALKVSVVGNTIDGTTMQNISASGVEVGGNYITVVGNTITNCGAFGVSVQDTQFFNVSGNVLSFNRYGVGIISTSSAQPPRYGAVKDNTITNSSDYGLYIYKVGTGGLITDCDLSDNHITTSVVRNIYLDRASGLISDAVAIARNDAASKATVTARANLGTLGTGTGKVIASFPFRPSLLRIHSVNPGAANRSSQGTVTVDAIGGLTQRSNAITENGWSINGGAIVLPSLLDVTVTAINYNTGTGNWDVIASITTNAGVGFWTDFTAHP
ncbi:right-handed parallel beta-helix repeat-containing protein [Microvirga sp. Mcv34]|uniref:right-handed parallel beta-helix repeat-containing protein n=1 Tax=Microvirga sp. Mcv34 TaxID=2926016 RepID=UPI0021C6F49D|nr:right-handed parallel beta-helix repeat-containing protein [Microvirga sp. Mcv34]